MSSTWDEDDLWEEPPSRSGRTITPLTRREIFDYLRVASFSWYGQVDELSFLGRFYDLGSLPSKRQSAQDC